MLVVLYDLIGRLIDAVLNIALLLDLANISYLCLIFANFFK